MEKTRVNESVDEISLESKGKVISGYKDDGDYKQIVQQVYTQAWGDRPAFPTAYLEIDTINDVALQTAYMPGAEEPVLIFNPLALDELFSLGKAYPAEKLPIIAKELERISESIKSLKSVYREATRIYQNVRLQENM